MQVYWRAIEASTAPDCLAALDVLISVQTSRLEADPALVITSGLPTRDVTRLDVSDLRDEARPTDGGAQRAPADCWVCHWPSPGFTYGEMVHPADFHHVALLTDDAADGAQSELVHHLFPQEIEKGVILRARARGVFAKGPRGAAAVAAAYREFLSCPLPLTA